MFVLGMRVSTAQSLDTQLFYGPEYKEVKKNRQHNFAKNFSAFRVFQTSTFLKQKELLSIFGQSSLLAMAFNGLGRSRMLCSLRGPCRMLLMV